MHCTRNSNNYFHEHIKPTLGRNLRHHSMKWNNIKVGKMAVFIGILLQMSLNPLDFGGCAAAFCENDQAMSRSTNAEPVTLCGTAFVTCKHMALNRFRQIRAAFHPEDKKQGVGGDKCHQLRCAINKFNEASRKTFHQPSRCML